MSTTDRIAGLKTSVAIKAPCRVATTANITLSGLQTVDGVSVVAGDRVLVKDQSDASENGIYDASAGAWTRAADFNASAEIVNGTEVLSVSGTANGGRRWYVSTASPAIGSDLAFSVVVTPSAGSEPSDGDKGDITVASSGLAWSINALAVVTGYIANLAVTTAKIANNAVTFAKIQQIDTARLLGRVTAGSGDIETLTKAQALSFLNVADGATVGVETAILAAEYASGTTPPSFSSGSWAALELNTERHDDIGVSISANQIVFANAGTYRIFAHIVAQNNSGGGRTAQLRTYNATQATVGDYGGAHSSQTAAASFVTVDSVITVAASDAVEVQGQASGANLSTFHAAGFGGETGLQVQIERLA